MHTQRISSLDNTSSHVNPKLDYTTMIFDDNADLNLTQRKSGKGFNNLHKRS